MPEIFIDDEQQPELDESQLTSALTEGLTLTLPDPLNNIQLHKFYEEQRLSLYGEQRPTTIAPHILNYGGARKMEFQKLLDEFDDLEAEGIRGPVYGLVSLAPSQSIDLPDESHVPSPVEALQKIFLLQDPEESAKLAIPFDDEYLARLEAEIGFPARPPAYVVGIGQSGDLTRGPMNITSRYHKMRVPLFAIYPEFRETNTRVTDGEILPGITSRITSFDHTNNSLRVLFTTQATLEHVAGVIRTATNSKPPWRQL